MKGISSVKEEISFQLSETSVKFQIKLVIHKTIYLWELHFSQVFGRCIFRTIQKLDVIFSKLFYYFQVLKKTLMSKKPCKNCGLQLS